MASSPSQESKQRSERRIAVRLPVWVRGRDRRGVEFEEATSSENLCRSGAAFVIRYEVDLGSDLEITIPLSQQTGMSGKESFATRGRVVHVTPVKSGVQQLVGVRFTGPRFQRVFRSESAH
jgi:hypothetical protein